jgi:hypothetical protein
MLVDAIDILKQNFPLQTVGANLCRTTGGFFFTIQITASIFGKAWTVV